ncbi:MAG: Rhamnulokinase [bacterium ADurb.Bin429]|nr:MAG: Rhamnulokinase [bacterium ADurb.Bin429]
MAKKIYVAAVDLGAESGRVSLGKFDGAQLEIEVVHRFSNESARLNGTLTWNSVGWFLNILKGLRLAKAEADGPIAAVGVDTWGVDFGILDGNGQLLGTPIHYRDSRTESLIEEVTAKHISREDIFARTGIAFWPFNTLFQLRAMANAKSPTLYAGSTLLFTPDLIHYWLSGAMAAERSIASTSQCMDVNKDAWAADLLEALDIPTDIMPEIVPSGTVLGPLLPEIADEVGISGMQVITPAAHDTASAVVATPLSSPNAAYLSSGTWSLLGIETMTPTATVEALNAEFTNERGIAGTYRFLQNIMGLWLVQQTRAAWARDGEHFDYAALAALAQDAPAFRAWINPNDLRFYAPANMVEEIRQACAESGQTVPAGVPDVMRTILESLAFTYRAAIDRLERIKGIRVPALHIIGGGSQNVVLSQWTANALGRPVITGPVEGTTMGNLLVQLMALGEIKNLTETRQVVRNSTEVITYQPRDAAAWEDAYGRFLQVTRQG